LKGHDVRALFLPLFYHPLGYFLGIILINSWVKWTRTARLTFYGGNERVPPALKLHYWISDVIWNGYAGALFGPIFTKWYQLLNKIQLPSATKVTAYRVRQSPLFLLLVS
jgi:hypothetical protein